MAYLLWFCPVVHWKVDFHSKVLVLWLFGWESRPSELRQVFHSDVSRAPSCFKREIFSLISRNLVLALWYLFCAQNRAPESTSSILNFYVQVKEMWHLKTFWWAFNLPVVVGEKVVTRPLFRIDNFAWDQNIKLSNFQSKFAPPGSNCFFAPCDWFIKLPSRIVLTENLFVNSLVCFELFLGF